MRKFNSIKAIACMAALVLASCSENETFDGPTDRVALSINASVGVETRASETSWEAGDGIGIFMLDAGTTDVSGIAMNLRYNASNTGENSSFTAENVASAAYFPGGKAPVDVYAYYPYEGTTTAHGVVTVNLSDQSNLTKIDLMNAKSATAHTSETPQVGLAFAHRLSKLVVNLETDASAVGVTLDGATMKLTGTAATGTYSLFDDVLTPGAAADIDLAIIPTGTKATAIVMPTAAGAGAKLVIATTSGKSYTAPFPAELKLENGKETTVNITLRQTDAAVTATIGEWTAGMGANISTLQIDVPTGQTGTPEVESFNLWKGSDESAAVSYAWSQGKWTATPTPFYVEDIQSGDLFSARHTPTTGNPEKDILEAGPVAADDGLIALDFAHINSKVTVTLAASTEYPDVSGATIAANGIYGSGDYAMTSGAAHIFLPQVLDASDALKVTLGTKTYTIAMTDITSDKGNLTELEANNAYAITLKVVKSGISATVSVGEWTEVTGSGDAKADISSTMTATGITEDGQLAITSNKKAGLYNYSTATSSFTTATPLYWDDLPSGSNSFEAIFTPSGNAKPEKDVLKGTATANWGEAINFSTLDHIHAKLKITLLPGEGFDDISGMTMKIVGLTTTPTEYTMNSGEEYIFRPIPITNAETLKVTADGYNYEIRLSSIKVNGTPWDRLAARSSYDITLTVSKSGLGMTATVNEWTPVTGSGTIEY